MRVERLDLTAFGPFSDVGLDLGGAPFHIVHGPNEAGKSTTRRALEGLLYGIPTTTPDAHLHPMPALRVGGRLRREDGAELRVVRRKGRIATLVDETGALVEESELERFLGGVGRDGFTRLFSLSHEGLTAGGRALCRDGGELGVSLFGAGLGAAVARLPRALLAEAREVWKPTGSTPPLNVALTEYARLRHAAADAALAVETHAELDARLRSARAERDRLDGEVAEARRALGRLERLHAVLPIAARHREAARRRLALGDVPALPATARAEREAASAAHAAARRGLERARADVGRLTAALEELHVPEALVAADEAVGDLHAGLGAYRATVGELPALRAALADARRRTAVLARELLPDGADVDVEALRPAGYRWAPVEELADAWPRLDEAREAARRDLEAARAARDRARAALVDLPAVPDPAPLRAALTAAQALGEADDALAALDADVGALQADVERALATLGVSCTAEQLERLPVPAPGTISGHGTLLDGIEGDRRAAAADLERARGRITELEAQLVALTRTGTPPDEAALAAARERRDAGWALIRAAWLAGGADPSRVAEYVGSADLPTAYEVAVDDADQTADTLRREADRVAELAQLTAARRHAEAEAARAGALLTTLEARAGEAADRWAALWAPVGVIPATPTEASAWSDRRARVQAAVVALRAARTRRDRLDDARGARRSELIRALAAVDAPAAIPHDDRSLRSVVACAAARLERLEEAERARVRLVEDVRRLTVEAEDAARAHERAARALAAWRERWTTATAVVGLEPGTPPAAVRAARAAAAALAAASDEAHALAARVEAAETAAHAYGVNAASVVARVAPDLAAAPVESAVPGVVERHRVAIAAAATRVELRDRLEEAEARRREHEGALEEAEATLARLRAAARCDDLAELAALEQRSEAGRLLDGELADLTDRIAELGAEPADRLLAETAGLHPDALGAEVRRARDEVAALEARRGAAAEASGRLAAQLEGLGGDGAAARADQDAQAALAAVRREAERYATLRLASALLDRQVEQHRREHGGPVLAAAHRLFGRLTRGAFAGLTTGWDERGDNVLLGLRPDGVEVPVEGMSDGTRDALYLALRLATIHAFVDAHEPLPVVLDDVLLNLDDRRAGAALRELDRLADRTQVLFFTHHAHLVRLAESAIPASRRRTHDLRRAIGTVTAADARLEHADVLLQLEL